MQGIKQLLIASKNKGKVKEFASIFGALGIEVRGIVDEDRAPDVIEDGDTFEANARKKAEAYAAHFGLPVLADDSGLSVDALDGEPGVYSARYAGEGATDADNNRKLIGELLRRDGGPDAAGKLQSSAGPVMPGQALSHAAFICALVLYDPDTGRTLHTEGRCPGIIVKDARGSGGFGYDPHFYLPDQGRTMAELTVEEKSAVSHRGQATARLAELLREG